MPVEITLGGQPCVDAIEEARNLARLGYPAPSEFARANCLLNPRGAEPARGWFLLLGSALAQLNVNALLTLQMTDGYGNTLTVKNLVIAREPTCLTPSGLGIADPNACYLVEVADARWRCHNPYYSIPIDAQYNVRAPGWGGAFNASAPGLGGTFYEATLAPPSPPSSPPAPWTWDGMIGGIWSNLQNQLGSYPHLPQGFTPDGTPERFRFVGVSAWPALCLVLAKLGLAVVWKATAPQNPFAIVAIGAGDAATTTQLQAASKRIIFDRVFPAVIRGRVAAGVSVHFHRVQEHYGSEPATAQDDTQFIADNVYTVEIDAPAAIEKYAETGVYHPLWDDLPALYDPTGTLLNGTQLQTRAQNRANAYYATIQGTGGGRRQQIYSGLLNLAPGAILSGVAWRQDVNALGDPGGDGGGLVTEVVTSPAMQVRVTDNGQFEEALADSSALRPPDLRIKEPVWPDLLQVLGAPETGTIGNAKASILGYNSDDGQWLTRDACQYLAQTGNVLGRLVGYDAPSGLPQYMQLSQAYVLVSAATPQTALLNGRQITDAILTSGSPTLTSPAQALFTSADVGKYLTGTGIAVQRAVKDAALTAGAATVTSATANFVNATWPLGDVGAAFVCSAQSLNTTIASVQSATQATLSVNAGSSVSAQTAEIGSNTQINSVTPATPPSTLSTATLSQNAKSSVSGGAVQIGSCFLTVFAAQIDGWADASCGFATGVSVSFYEVNGGAPTAGTIYQCRLLATALNGTQIWAAASPVPVCTVTLGPFIEAVGCVDGLLTSTTGYICVPNGNICAAYVCNSTSDCPTQSPPPPPPPPLPPPPPSPPPAPFDWFFFGNQW